MEAQVLVLLYIRGRQVVVVVVIWWGGGGSGVVGLGCCVL